MKRVIQTLLLAALALPLASYAAISGTKVWGNGATVANGAWPVSVDLTGHTPSAGNILVACQTRNDDNGSLTATTPAGWTAGPVYATGSAGALAGAMFWKKAAGDETLVSLTWSLTDLGGSWSYVEIPGTDLNVDTLGDSGENEGNVGTATTSLSSGSATNATATGLAVACLMTDNGGNDVTGWTNSFNEQQESNYAGTVYTETFLATKVLSSSASQTTSGTITNDQGYGAILVFNASGSTCPATCAGGRSARCITDTSNNTDTNNILYGQSPAVVANEDTVCYPSTSVLGDTVNVTADGYPSFASAGKTATDSFTYTINDNGTGEGTPGKYETSFQPVIDSVTGIATGQTTADITVTPSGPTEGTVQSVAISKTSYDTYGAPTHAQIRAGVDANNSNVAWGSEFTKSFLSTVSPGWTFGRASSQTYEKSDGTLGTVTSGNPAFQYSGGTAQGILLEGQRIALNGYGSDPRSWSRSTTKTNYTTTELGIFALGSREASAGEVWHRIYQDTSLAASTAHAITFYYMAGTSGNAYLEVWHQGDPVGSKIQGTIGSLSTVSGVDAPISNVVHTDMGGGVWRTTCVLTTTTAGTYRLSIGPYSATVGEDIIVLGAQIEAGAFPSSFILNTTSGAATRVATSLTRSWNFPSNGISGQAVVRPQFAYNDTKVGYYDFLTISDGTSSNKLRISTTPTTDVIHLLRTVGTESGASTTAGELNYARNERLNIRFRADSAGVKMWIDGDSSSTVDECTSAGCKAAFTTSPNTIWLESSSGTSSAINASVIESLTIWNEAKSDAFLEALE